MTDQPSSSFLSGLRELLSSVSQVPVSQIQHVLAKARTGQGLSLKDSATLLLAPEDFNEPIFATAAEINAQIKGQIITFYGVVYIHDYCTSHCTYCGDSVHAVSAKRTLLSPEELVADVQVLLAQHDLQEICFLMGEDWIKFKHADLVRYLQAVATVYRNKIILNIPPLPIARFQEIREALPAQRLHFRVFQETFDRDIYAREHLAGAKKDFDWRVGAQARALKAGFDEVGHGVLYGLNDKPHGHEFDTLAMLAHAHHLHETYGRRSQSMSFPRVLPAPDIDYHPAAPILDATLTRCVAVAKLSDPHIDTVITCREKAEFRRSIRPLVNIEDFAARPGPGGNSIPEARTQMFLPDMRAGHELEQEMIEDGYTVR